MLHCIILQRSFHLHRGIEYIFCLHYRANCSLRVITPNLQEPELPTIIALTLERHPIFTLSEIMKRSKGVPLFADLERKEMHNSKHHNPLDGEILTSAESDMSISRPMKRKRGQSNQEISEQQRSDKVAPTQKSSVPPISPAKPVEKKRRDNQIRPKTPPPSTKKAHVYTPAGSGYCAFAPSTPKRQMTVPNPDELLVTPMRPTSPRLEAIVSVTSPRHITAAAEFLLSLKARGTSIQNQAAIFKARLVNTQACVDELASTKRLSERKELARSKECLEEIVLLMDTHWSDLFVLEHALRDIIDEESGDLIKCLTDVEREFSDLAKGYRKKIVDLLRELDTDVAGKAVWEMMAKKNLSSSSNTL